MAARVFNREPLPNPDDPDKTGFIVAGEVWQHENLHVEPRVLLAIVNPIMVETVGGITTAAIALSQCQMLDLVRDVVNEWHNTAHKAQQLDPSGFE